MQYPGVIYYKKISSCGTSGGKRVQSLCKSVTRYDYDGDISTLSYTYVPPMYTLMSGVFPEIANFVASSTFYSGDING